MNPTTEAELEELLSIPSAGLVTDLEAVDGDVAILGAGGKMGPSLAWLARRALDAAGRRESRVIAISRWSDTEAAKRLVARGVEVVTADVSVDADLSGLPDAPNVIYMVGAKFGTAGRPHEAWTVNTVLPALVAERYRNSRFVAFSTGNVYPLAAVAGGGPTEEDPVGPVGEYAMSCLGRERVVAAVSERHGTPAAVLRLNYAVEPRYGVIADVATKVRDRMPIDVTTGHVNVVWQGYANEVALRALRHAQSPPLVLNLTGPETASVRRLAVGLGELLGEEPRFTGTEAATALLSNAGRCHGLFGRPTIGLGTLVSWQAEWMRSGGTLWHKQTKFDRRDGKF